LPDLLSHCIRFRFVVIIRFAEGEFPPTRAAALLHDMRQLMRQQLPACRVPRIVRSTAEENVLARRKGDSIYGAVQSICFRIGMNSYGAKIGAEGRFHPSSHPAVQRLPGTSRPLNGLLDFGFKRRSTVSFSV
jgi:hypothetical protein